MGELHTHSLELAYEKSRVAVNLACEAEKSRHLYLKIMLVQDENEELHTQLLQYDDRINELELALQHANTQSELQAKELGTLQGEKRSRLRELDTLRVSYS